jgi:transposase
MSYQSKLTIKESVESLRGSYASSKDHRVKLKIRSLILFVEHPEKRQQDIADHLCIGHSTLKRWYKQYREQGFSSFASMNMGGNKPSVVPQEIHQALEEKLHDSSNPLSGYWDAVLWVESNFGLKIKYQTLRNYMIKHFKCKLKSPRKSHYQKDEQAIEAFFKTA